MARAGHAGWSGPTPPGPSPDLTTKEEETMFRKRQSTPSQAVMPMSATHRIGLLTVFAAATALMFRYRRQLTPVYVAVAVWSAGWLAWPILWLAGGWWMFGFYAVGTLCGLAWLYRVSHPYDKLLGFVVLAAALVWTLLMANDPLRPNLWGAWLLAWPVVGLGWWLGPSLRGQLRADRVRGRWASAAGLAGLAGAHLTSSRATRVGEVLTIELSGEQTADDVKANRLESAMELRPGAVKIERDKANARRVHVHVSEVDPWAQDLVHPAMNLVAHLTPANEPVTR
jgi:hypothetical protein